MQIWLDAGLCVCVLCVCVGGGGGGGAHRWIERRHTVSICPGRPMFCYCKNQITCISNVLRCVWFHNVYSQL